MKTSIACAIYDGSTYLIKQLESIYRQTTPADEVIIIDDCSNDHSYQLVKDYIETNHLRNWFLFQHECNKGYIQTFYDALQNCHNDIIFLCDQDDIWNEHKIKMCLAYFKSHPNTLCINTSYDLINQQSEPISQSSPDIKETQLTFEHILLKNISMGCTMAMKKELVATYLKNSIKQAPHDWELNILAASMNRLAYLSTPLIQYRIHDKNTTGLDTFSGQQIQSNKREKNAETISNFVNALHVYTFSSMQNEKLNIYTSFSQLRYQLLNEKKYLNWFRLLKHYRLYSELLSQKGIIADILYTILKKRSN